MINTVYHKEEFIARNNLCRNIKDRIIRFAHTHNGFIVKVNVFIPSVENYRERKRCEKIRMRLIENLKKDSSLPGVPAITIIEQGSIGRDSIAMDFFWFDPTYSSDSVYYSFFRGLPFVQISGSKRREVWCSGYYAMYEEMNNKNSNQTDVFSATTKNLLSLQKLLEFLNLSFDNIVRQWNYIGNILGQTSEYPATENSQKQVYQEFNTARDLIYSRYKKNKIYPAATGIGTTFRGVVIDAVMISSSNTSETVTTLQSPIQSEAFSYSENVLIGESNNKKPPLFSRGRLWRTVDSLRAFCMVSGTASIIGENTIDPDDHVKQLCNTLKFIDDLIDTIDHVGKTATRIRLYIKPNTPKDIVDCLEYVLTKKHPKRICIIVYADICRDNLLVEVEADFIITLNTNIPFAVFESLTSLTFCCQS